MNFFQIKGIPATDLAEGVSIRLVPADRMSLVFFYLSPGARIPEHAHFHEQMGMVLKGSILLTIGDEEKIVLPGIVYRVPPDVLHGGRCLEEGAEVIEVFSPPRKDLLEKIGGITIGGCP
jgi:quercetin dioxygenase-like cupin family protein